MRATPIVPGLPVPLGSPNGIAKPVAGQVGLWGVWTIQGQDVGTVTEVDTGTGLTGGPITTTGTISIANTGVVAGTYTNVTLTVNAQGQLTAASSGSPPAATVDDIAPITDNAGFPLADGAGNYIGTDLGAVSQVWDASYWYKILEQRVKAKFVQTQDVTVANTVTETDLTGTGEGTLTLPVDFFFGGSTLKIDGFGYHSSLGSPTLQIRVYAGATVLLDTGAIATNNSTNTAWQLEGMITCRTAGVTGTVIGQGIWLETGGGANLFGMVNTANITLDTTVAQAVRVTATWGTATANNTITMTNLVLTEEIAL